MTERNSADSKQLKVTDKRMFTPDGDLREEFQDLAQAAAAEKAAAEKAATTDRPAPEVGRKSTLTSPQEAGSSPSAAGPAKAAAGGYPSGAQFEDLVALLAQTTVTFLQQASRPQSRNESLDQAQLYLDLLGILEDKTTGNLTPAEKSMLQDALRQLRLAFAQRG